MNRILRVCVYGALCCFGYPLCGQDIEQRYELGLREAIALSLSKSFTVRIERLDPQRAEERVRQSKGVFDPSLTLSGGVASEEAIGEDEEVDEAFASVSVDGILPWGARYRVGVNGIDRDRDFLGQAAGANGGVTLRVSQPLLRNFGAASNYSGVRIAEKGLERRKQELRQTMMQTVANTVDVYSALYFAKRNLEIAVTNRDLAKQLMVDNERRLKVGSIAAADLRVAETRYALRKETVLIAERQLRERENAMKQLISDSVEGILDLRLEVTGLDDPRLKSVDARKDFAAALEKRPDYRSALLGLDIDRLELRRDRQRKLPQLELVGGIDYDAKGSSLGGSVSNLRNERADSYSLETVFSVPIPNRSDRSQHAISRINLDQAEIGLEQIKQAILLRLDNAARRVESSWQRIEVTKEARSLAERSLEAEEKKLNLGASRSFFVLELQGDLANAQIRETRSMTDYYRAVAQYELERGTILESYDIAGYD